MNVPDSFCFICTYNCCYELIGMLLSLSIHHINSIVYGIVDSKTKEELERMTPKLKLNLKLFVTLDKYSGKNRMEMVALKIWDKFQMQKAEAIRIALEYANDTMFLDSDILFINSIDNIDKSNELGLSPHYIKKSNTDEVGYFNGGVLWTKNRNVPNDWVEFTKTSRYHDQASIEDLAKKYSYQEFGEEINVMPWRLLLADNPQQIINNINIQKNDLYYKDKPLIFIHTHFLDGRFKQFNSLIINALTKLKRYKELLIIEKIINNKWTIKIPKQPQMGIWRHANDSFRKLAMLLSKHNPDIKIELTDNGHCWLAPNVLLYDRPTREWFNNDLTNTSMILLGNGSMEEEGKILKQNNLNILPWIFWPRRPFILEKILDNNPRLSFDERTCESIFIGNFENSVQQKYRQTTHNWESVLSEYHCTKGTAHKFTQQEYLMKLRSSKYGLCLRGYGSKCHREVELMALGSVPIVTPEVSINSYMDQPIENIHYISVSTPDELKDKISNISKEKWEEMSKACYGWYQKNVYSKNCWENMISNLLYK